MLSQNAVRDSFKDPDVFFLAITKSQRKVGQTRSQKSPIAHFNTTQTHRTDQHSRSYKANGRKLFAVQRFWDRLDGQELLMIGSWLP